jgi:hypothetical protein
MPDQTRYVLAPPIHVDALYERVEALCAALGLAWAATHTPAATTLHVDGSATRKVTTSSWSDGVITLSLRQEIGDNGATQSSAWYDWFTLGATLDGLPDGASVQMEGRRWAPELTHILIEGASPTAVELILTTLGAQRLVTPRAT